MPLSPQEHVIHELIAAQALVIDALSDRRGDAGSAGDADDGLRDAGIPEGSASAASSPSAAPPAASLAAAAQLMDTAERALHLLVQDSRRHGLTWAQIGESLGISRQAAQRRFSAQVPAKITAPRHEVPTQAIKQALDLMTDAATGRFDRIDACASPSLRSSMQGLSWQSVFEPARTIFGDVVRRDEPTAQVIAGLYRITAREERTLRAVEAEVLMSASGALLGMHYNPVSADAADAEPTP